MDAHLLTLFDLPAETIYLNTCGAGPRLHAVNEAAEAALTASARPWQTSEADWHHAVENLRRTTAALLGTTPDALAFCPSVGHGISLAARNLAPTAGQNVVVLAGEHPSNRLAWEHACARSSAAMRSARREEGQSWTDAVLQSIDTRTAVVSVPHAHWADGALLELPAIAAAARAVGAALVIDASQSLGVLPLDFDALAPDFVIAPGHKWLLGAYGLGWLWAAPAWREHGQPLEHGIAARQAEGDFASLDHTPDYRKGARRFDFGAHAHPLLVPMALAAVNQLQTWGLDTIRSRVHALVHHLRTGLTRRGLGDGLTPHHAPHFCAWRPPPDRLAAVTSAARKADCIVASRAGALRIAPYLHIDERQIDRLVDVLARSI